MNVYKKYILELCLLRGPRKSICPAEVARKVSPDQWQQHMHLVRAAAGELVKEGKVVVTKKGFPVDADTAKGPVRIRLFLNQT